ncbi:MAG: DUF4157 domain-containing protein [Ginsengibacter sp.]
MKITNIYKNPTSEKNENNKFFFQPKLAINAPNDIYEQEADAMADKVMRMGENDQAFFSPNPLSISGVQRKCEHCEEEEKKVQRKETDKNVSAASSQTENYLNELSGGNSLSKDERSFFEPRFGYDFSNVKIHTDSKAAKSAQSMNALAYTSDNNIVFNTDKFSPATDSGKRLLGHELTHVVQQNRGKVSRKMIQRDLAVEPTSPDAIGAVLTARQIREAIVYNQRDFTEPDEIGLLRDVLGVSKEPMVIDEDFVHAVAQYQANFGLKSDGKLGRTTATGIATEITAEADSMGDAQRGSERRRIARRMQLRGMVSERSGILAYRNFVGDKDRPTGMVSARVGGDEHTAFGAPQANDVITLEYTGEDAARVRWLQFINIRMQGFQPAVAAPVFNAGTINATGGAFNYSNAATTNWGVDSASATVPFYDAAGIHIMNARSSIMGDQPQGWQPTANAFAATLAPHADRVVLTFNFDTYAVRDGTTPVHHIRWSATYEFNITTGTEGTIRYSRIGGGAIRRLTAAHRAVVDARYAGNGVL